MAPRKTKKTNANKNEAPLDPYDTAVPDASNIDVDVEMDDDTARILDGNTSNNVESQTSSDHGSNTKVSNDDTELLNELISTITQFTDDAIANVIASEDEEGAIKEDEIPFERRAESGSQTNIIHLLNVPPEIVNDSLMATISKFKEIVNHCFICNVTEIKIIFSTLSLASEAKRLIDNMKLYNRRVQVIYSKTDEYKPKNFYQDPKSSRHGVRMIPAPPTVPPYPPVPPSYQIPPAPPGRGSSHFFEDHRANNRIQFGRLISKMEGKSLAQMIEERPVMLTWHQNQSMEDMQKEFDKVYEDFAIFNRYLIVGGLPSDVTSNTNSAENWLSKYTTLPVDLEIVTMPTYLPKDISSDTYLHVTFQKRLDCRSLMQKILELNEGIICKFSTPIAALDSLWLGNVGELCGFCKNEDDLSNLFTNFGDVKNFRFIPERSCIFVTFASVNDAVYARNKLVGLSLTNNKSNALNVDFATSDSKAQLHRNNHPRHNKEDLSHNLGGKLLAAIQKRADGDILIKKLLSDDSDILSSLNKSNNREPKVDRFGRTIRTSDERQPWSSKSRKRNYSSSRSEPSKRQKSNIAEKDAPAADQEPRGTTLQTMLCKLLKRGKPICNISALFIRGDPSHKLPQLLDVNQRANPERLKNTLQKAPELSLWQLGADTRDDSVKYDGLCDYLISKGRVALVQDGPYEIYIVPPYQDYVEMLSMPDAQFMYAYLLPKGD